MIEANTNLEIDDEQEWEEILFGTLEEGVMGQLALGTVLAILAGKALESTGVLSNFPVGSAQRYELIAAYGASVGLASRYILGLAGEKLARRARRQAASLSNEIQETIAEGLVSDPKFVSLLDNLRTKYHQNSQSVQEECLLMQRELVCEQKENITVN